MVGRRRDISSEPSPLKGCNLIKSFTDTEAPPWQNGATNNPKTFIWRLFCMRYGGHQAPGSWGALLPLLRQGLLAKIHWIDWLLLRYVHDFYLFHNKPVTYIFGRQFPKQSDFYPRAYSRVGGLA